MKYEMRSSSTSVNFPRGAVASAPATGTAPFREIVWLLAKPARPSITGTCLRSRRHREARFLLVLFQKMFLLTLPRWNEMHEIAMLCFGVVAARIFQDSLRTEGKHVAKYY